MSTLTGTQINQTYQGLLKLANSTTGITASLQSVQDGLGNDTGLKIAQNRLEGGNISNMYKPSIPQYMGCGISNTGTNPAGGSQNVLTTNTFYDVGLYSYSAFTVNCGTLEAGTSVDIAFYNSQYLDGYGYVPYQKLTTEVNIDTTSTGYKIGTFSSPLSFSGTGGGFYWCVIRYNTPSVPALRLNGSAVSGVNALTPLTISNGFQFNSAGTAAMSAYKTTSTLSSAIGSVFNIASFPSTWTSTEFDTISSTLAGQIGFLLHTIR